jgi:subtilisin family serine protease
MNDMLPNNRRVVIAVAIIALLLSFAGPGSASSRGLNQIKNEFVSPDHAEDTTLANELIEKLWNADVKATSQSSFSADRLIITLKESKTKKKEGGDVDSRQASALSRISTISNVKSIEKLSDQSRIHRVTISNPKRIKRTVAELKNDEDVMSVEYDQIVNITDFTPNDPFFTQERLWGLQKIRAPTAWDTSMGNKQVIVCVIDTGVDYNHQDLAANMWRNPGETGLDSLGRDKATNGVDDDMNGIVDGECLVPYDAELFFTRE